MKSKLRDFKKVFLILSLIASSWSCGSSGGHEDLDADVETDGEEGDAAADADTDPADADGVEDPSDEDADDMVGDDAPDEDAVGPGEGNPLVCETAGGAALASESYRLELFLAPVRPVGSVSSESYRLKLGPASTRSNP
jgi:hypothetical protein